MSYSPDIISPPFYGVEAEIRGKQLIVPALNLSVNGLTHVLTWGNSCIREFDDSTYDHVEIEEDDGSKSGIWADEDMMEGMRSHLYPVLFRPIVDDASYEWFVSMSMTQLEKELGL